MGRTSSCSMGNRDFKALQVSGTGNGTLGCTWSGTRERLRLDKSIHHEFISHKAGEIISELRACRDVYRTGLVDVNKTLSIKTPRETLCCYAVEYAVVPRAASLIRASLRDYFEFANIRFDAVQLLFDTQAGCVLFPMREPMATEQGKPTVSSARPQVTTIEPAKDWPELLQRMIPDASSDEAISADDKNAHNEPTSRKSLARQGCSKFASRSRILFVGGSASIAQLRITGIGVNCC